MKANEFIKKYSIYSAKRLVETAPLDKREKPNIKYYEGNAHWIGSNIDICIDVKELKRLIESHELIEKCGGYEQVKLIIQAIPNCLKFYDDLGCLMFNPITKRYFQFSNGVSYAFLGSAFSVDMYGKSANRIKNDCIYIHDLKKSIADVESCQ